MSEKYEAALDIIQACSALLRNLGTIGNNKYLLIIIQIIQPILSKNWDILEEEKEKNS